MMRSRKKYTFSESFAECSTNGSPLRQMTITESFKNTKAKPKEKKVFKLSRPSMISSTVFEVSDESDVETRPMFPPERRKLFYPIGSDSEDSIKSQPIEASPPKRQKITIGVHKPKTSTPSKSPETTPSLSPLHTSRTDPLNDSMTSVCSVDSDKTITYEYDTSNRSNNFEQDKSGNNGQNFPSQTSNEELRSAPGGVARRLNFDNEVNYDEDTVPFNEKNAVEMTLKKNCSGGNRKRKSDYNSEGGKSKQASKNINNIKPKNPNSGRQSDVDINLYIKSLYLPHSKNVGSDVDKISKKKRKCNLSSKQNSSKKKCTEKNIRCEETAQKGQISDLNLKIENKESEKIQKLQKVAANSREEQSQPKKQAKEKPTLGDIIEKLKNSPAQKSKPNQTENFKNSQQEVGCLEKSDLEAPKKLPVSVTPETNNKSINFSVVDKETPRNNTNVHICQNVLLSSSINKVIQEMSAVDRSNVEVTSSKSSDVTNDMVIETPEKRKVNVTSATNIFNISGGIDKKPSRNNPSSSNVNIEKTGLLSPAVHKNNEDICEVAKDSKNASYTLKTNKSIQDEVKSLSKTSNLEQQPCGSKSLNEAVANTPKKNVPNSPLVKKSPGKKSPVKYGSEIKNLKAKEGKQLQKKHLDKLVGLFENVTKSRHLRNILSKPEGEIIIKFIKMEFNTQYVVMKLLVWKKRWYNIHDFSTKAEIRVENKKDINDIFENLKEKNFVDSDYAHMTDMRELLNTLDRIKVRSILQELNVKPIKNNKTDNINTLMNLTSTQTTLTCTKTFKDIIMDRIKNKMGFSVKLKQDVQDTLYQTYLLATFTYPDFEDIQIFFRNIIYEEVVFPECKTEDYVVFTTKKEFVSYARALEMRRELEEEQKLKKNQGIWIKGDEALAKLKVLKSDDNVYDSSPAPHLKIFTAKHVYTKILSICCESVYTKQSGYPSDVKKWLEYLIEQFPSSQRLGKWYFRLISLHIRHLDIISFENAAKILIDVLENKKNNLSEIDLHKFGTQGKTLTSSKKFKLDSIYHDKVIQLIPRQINKDSFTSVQVDSQTIRSNIPGRKRHYISKDENEMTIRGVEHVALEYYHRAGYLGGKHCEGHIIKALLTLFFWDIIYDPPENIPGTFISNLQSAPLDMFTPYFYQNRKAFIDKRIKDIDHGWSGEEVLEFARKNWQIHSREKSAFGMVENIIGDIATVDVLVSVIGCKVLAKIFQRLIQNLGQCSSGMPDLLVWNVDKGVCKFVEVKGEGDKLSIGQMLWLQYLKEAGAQIEVCYVHSTGSKRKKNNKVPTEDEEASPS